jgi:antitoxin component YwqK of YwqJK toxin-antitoxin module
MENLEYNCQLTSYINMQNLYEHLYIFGNNVEKQELKTYRKIIQNIGKVGFQLKPEGNLMKTTLLTHSLQSPDKDYDIDINRNSAEELIIKEFQDLSFKVNLGEEFANYNGKIDHYLTHPVNVKDSVLVHEGELNNGNLNGIWRSYYLSNNIKSVVNYMDNRANGTAIFYYDTPNHIIKAEIDFSDDTIDGSYKEYYFNGNIKAKIDFKNGVRWGDAYYYFKNGQIKIEGQFKKGKQVGKWKHYSKSGELLKKENW